MRKASAGKALLQAIEEYVLACVPAAEPDDWIDQVASPLGRRRHLALARRGELPAVKDGKRVLVRRSDLEAYLARRGAWRTELIGPPEKPTSDAVAAEILASLGLELKGPGANAQA